MLPVLRSMNFRLLNKWDSKLRLLVGTMSSRENGVNSTLNGDRADRIAKQAKSKRKPAVVFATHKFMSQKELTDIGIVFCGLPYNGYGV